jgi:hypothetical protein
MNEIRKLPLRGKRGGVALVDGDFDGEYFAQFKWAISKNGYVCRRGRRLHHEPITVYLHREVSRPPKGMWVLFFDGNPLNCTSENLGWVTPQEMALIRKPGKLANGGYIGVRKIWWRTYRYSGWFVAMGSSSKYLGIYPTAEEAARARDEWAKQTQGDLARLNFPESLER